MGEREVDTPKPANLADDHGKDLSSVYRIRSLTVEYSLGNQRLRRLVAVPFATLMLNSQYWIKKEKLIASGTACLIFRTSINCSSKQSYDSSCPFLDPTLLLLRLLILAQRLVPLSRDAFLSPLTCSLGLVSLGLHLLLQNALTLLLSLGFVDLKASVSACVQYEEDLDWLTCSTRARLCLNVLPLLR